MLSYFIIFIITLCMAFLGSYLGLCIAAKAENNIRKKDILANSKRKTGAQKKLMGRVWKRKEGTVFTVDESAVKNPFSGHLNKADQKKASYTDFCCDLDNIDAESAIRTKMRRQDTNYQTLKYK